MSATMVRQGGQVQLEQSDMQLALNMAKMAIEEFSRATIEEMQLLMKKPRAKVREKNISKKHFRPGGMPPSEWTRSVRAVRDTPVADYSAPSVNTTRRIPYRPPIAVSVHACIGIAMQWVTLRKSLLTFLLH